MEFHHESVLLGEVIENLAIVPEGIYIDGTVGGGGHSAAIAAQLGEKGRLIGIDQDKEAIAAAAQRLSPYLGKVTLLHENYESIPEILKDMKIEAVDGILLDLGVSSYQIDNPKRGFSYNEDEPLDMRMDQDSALTAEEIVNTWSQEELTRILRDYGEERYASNIALQIVSMRNQKKLTTTGDLEKVVRAAIPMKMQRKYGNPCKRTFQAIRIACNRELEVLENSLDPMIGVLKPGGRICVITFHSLEDRIVKQTFKRNENPCTCPPEFPVCVCGKKSRGKVITRKPIVPSEEEIARNRRSQSAKLRVFEKAKEIEDSAASLRRVE